MTYTQIALLATLIMITADIYVFKTKLLTRRVFWVSYSIVIFFQLVTNGILTGFGIVKYDGAAIIGSIFAAGWFATNAGGRANYVCAGRRLIFWF